MLSYCDHEKFSFTSFFYFSVHSDQQMNNIYLQCCLYMHIIVKQYNVRWYQPAENFDVYQHSKNQLYQSLLSCDVTRILDTCYFEYFKGCARYIFASLFPGLNKSTCQIQKNVFYFTSKPLSVVEKI